MHSWLNITIALTVPESASWRVVGNPGNYGQGPGKRIIKGRPLEVDFDCLCQRLQQGAPS